MTVSLGVTIRLAALNLLPPIPCAPLAMKMQAAAAERVDSGTLVEDEGFQGLSISNQVCRALQPVTYVDALSCLSGTV